MTEITNNRCQGSGEESFNSELEGNCSLTRLHKIRSSARFVVLVWKNLVEFRPALRKNKKRFLRAYDGNPKLDAETSIADFESVKRLGKGTFANVELARNKETREVVALKIIKKEKILKKVYHLKNEKRIHLSVDHPLIAKMHSCFTDSSHIYFCMEYYSGGDLCTFLGDHGRCGLQETKFFAAQLVLAVSYLHSVGVVHRDLKVENVLIDREGYFRLADFGFAKRIGREGRTSTVCGSYCYMAPEVFRLVEDKKEGYGCSVDWWSLGVLLYVATADRFPFKGIGPTNFRTLLNGAVDYPPYVHRSTASFLSDLLQTSKQHRLGCGAQGGEEVKRHRFFRGLDWASVYFRKVVSPILPSFRHPDEHLPKGDFDIGTKSTGKDGRKEEKEGQEEDSYQEYFKDF